MLAAPENLHLTSLVHQGGGLTVIVASSNLTSSLLEYSFTRSNSSGPWKPRRRLSDLEPIRRIWLWVKGWFGRTKRSRSLFSGDISAICKAPAIRQRFAVWMFLNSRATHGLKVHVHGAKAVAQLAWWKNYTRRTRRASSKLRRETEISTTSCFDLALSRVANHVNN